MNEKMIAAQSNFKFVVVLLRAKTMQRIEHDKNNAPVKIAISYIAGRRSNIGVTDPNPRSMIVADSKTGWLNAFLPSALITIRV